jgi:hypothetical protein
VKGEGKRECRVAVLIEITDQRPIHAISSLQEQIFPSAPSTVVEVPALAQYGIARQQSQQHHSLRASSSDFSCYGILPTDPYRHAVWMPLHNPLCHSASCQTSCHCGLSRPIHGSKLHTFRHQTTSPLEVAVLCGDCDAAALLQHSKTVRVLSVRPSQYGSFRLQSDGCFISHNLYLEQFTRSSFHLPVFRFHLNDLRYLFHFGKKSLAEPFNYLLFYRLSLSSPLTIQINPK